MEQRKFKPGQVWQARDGALWTIDSVSDDKGRNFPVIASCAESGRASVFTLDGDYYAGPIKSYEPDDLVELFGWKDKPGQWREVTPPAEQETFAAMMQDNAPRPRSRLDDNPAFWFVAIIAFAFAMFLLMGLL